MLKETLLSFSYRENNHFSFKRSKNNYFYSLDCENKLFRFIYFKIFYLLLFIEHAWILPTYREQSKAVFQNYSVRR